MYRVNANLGGASDSIHRDTRCVVERIWSPEKIESFIKLFYELCERGVSLSKHVSDF